MKNMTKYNKDKIFQQSKELIVEKGLVFIEEIIDFLPISKPTFYEYFKIDSDELNEIKDLINVNKTNTKIVLRKKWKESENATLQLALYRLLSTEEEHKKLNQSSVDVTTQGEKINQIHIFNIPDDGRNNE